MPETAGNSGSGEDSSAQNSQVETSGQQNDAEVPQAPQPAQQSQWEMFKSFAMRMLIFYFIMNFMRGGKTPAPNTSTDGSGEITPAQTFSPARNMYSEGYSFDLKFYLSESEKMPRAVEHVYTEGGVRYMEWSGGENDDATYTFTHLFNASQNVLKNGSIYLHVWMLPEHEDPFMQEANDQMHIHKVKQLNKFKKRRYISTVNLLTGKTDIHPDLIKKENGTDVEVLSHWHPNLTLNFINDQTNWVKGSIPKPLDEYIEFTMDNELYYPPLFFNDYWNLQSDYMPINETTPQLNLTVTIYPLSMIKWQFYSAQGMRNQWYSDFLGDGGAEQSDEEQDVLKRTMLDTNPYLLAVTIVVSIVHSVFEFLAFKNDIQFWRERKSLEGLSVRSVFFSVFQSLIVLLYILDNETNFVVKISVFIGLLIEIWKINKVVNIRLDFENKWFDMIPRITFTDKSTYVESKTREYDQMAFRYLSWLLYPLLFGYGIYSLMYHEHKGWYSWVLNMLYGFLLMFGFIMMTPQLFINYKLKSVAHLPWRMMTYKALNTFVDDLFAFVIKMPTLYRIGCFRDDIVFLIFLYQRWIYKVDPTRVNEFGTSGESDQPADDGPPIENQESTSPSAEGVAIKSKAEKKNE